MALIGIGRGRAIIGGLVAMIAIPWPCLAAQDSAPPSAMEKKGIATVQDAIMALARADKDNRSTPVKVLGNPGAFFGAAAYPPDALNAGQQGRSVVRVAIDARGFPTGCSVFSSSGSSSLDQATCRVATTRMQFAAAHDEKGRAIAGQYTLPVRWILPVGVTTLTLPSAVNTSLAAEITVGTVGTDGAVESCSDGMGGPAGAPGPCAMWPVGRKILAPPTRDGRPVKAHIMMSVDVATSIDP